MVLMVVNEGWRPYNFKMVAIKIKTQLVLLTETESNKTYFIK